MLKKIFFLVLLIFIILNCGKEKKYTEIGLDFEKKFKKTEALYFYTLAINENEDFFLAHKRIAILLSESYESQDVAIYHFEKAFQLDKNDTETNILFFDILLTNKQFDKIKSINKELVKNLNKELIELFGNIQNCISNKDESKKMITKIESNSNQEILALPHKSLSLCYDIAGLKEKKFQILEKF